MLFLNKPLIFVPNYHFLSKYVTIGRVLVQYDTAFDLWSSIIVSTDQKKGPR